FQAQPAKGKVRERNFSAGQMINKIRERLRRRFIVIEEKLSREASRLMQHLRQRGAVELNIENIRKLLNLAPTIIVMSETQIDVKFWDISAETVNQPKDGRNLR